MDGDLAIEHNRQALLSVLVSLVAMAGLDDARATLPRFLRNAVLRLVRPAEAAVRRLAIALGCRLTVTLPAQQERAIRQNPTSLVKPGTGTGIVMPRGVLRPAILVQRLPLPLFDPLPRPFAVRKPLVPVRHGPRISTPGFGAPWQPPPALSANDQVDAHRLRLRLTALERALANLEAEALRFARWQARQQRARKAAQEAPQSRPRSSTHRRPLRQRRPTGPRGRRHHAVHDIVESAHRLAVFALERRDTS